MQNFGEKFKRIDELKACIESVSGKELLDFGLSKEKQAVVDSVSIPVMESGEYKNQETLLEFAPLVALAIPAGKFIAEMLVYHIILKLLGKMAMKTVGSRLAQSALTKMALGKGTFGKLGAPILKKIGYTPKMQMADVNGVIINTTKYARETEKKLKAINAAKNVSKKKKKMGLIKKAALIGGGYLALDKAGDMIYGEDGDGNEFASGGNGVGSDGSGDAAWEQLGKVEGTGGQIFMANDKEIMPMQTNFGQQNKVEEVADEEVHEDVKEELAADQYPMEASKPMGDDELSNSVADTMNEWIGDADDVPFEEVSTSPVEIEEKITPQLGDQLKVVGGEKKSGSAGNPVEPESDTPQLGGLGMGNSLKKEMNRGLNENFNTPEEVVDESPKDDAKESFEHNGIISQVKSDFNDIFDNKFGKAKKKEYDLDGTTVKNTVSDTPIKRIPPGW